LRYRAALALIIAVLCQALAARAEGPGPPGFATPAPIASAAPTAAPQPAQGQWTVNRTAIGLVLDELTTKMFGIFLKFTDRSVQLAQTLFMALASLEFGWTAIRWMVSQVPLEEYVANSFFKAVQMGLLFLVISNSYSSPFGPGWFMMVVNGIVGMAQDTAGFAVVGTSNTGQFTPIITPGTIVDIGLRLFTLIMSAASGGVNGWNLLSGLTNGATLIYFGTWCFCLVSACGAVFTMAWIGFRWLWITLKALWLGMTMFMTGFTGSRVTASIGYGPFNGAFNVGIEMAAHVVIIGLFYPIITSYAGSIGFAQALEGVPSYAGPGAGAPTPAGPMVIQIGAVLLLDLGLALWTYAIKHAPDLAQFAVSGAIRLNERDALEGSKSESGALQAGAAAARLGAGALAAFGGGGEGEREPSAGDRLKGAFSGALRGGMMAGPEGALGGAVMGAASATASQPSGQDEGRISGGGQGAGAAANDGGHGAFTGGFVDVRGGQHTGDRPARGGGPDKAQGSAADARAAAAAPSAGGGEGVGGDQSVGGAENVGRRGTRTVRSGGTEIRAEREADRVAALGATGGSGADAAAPDAASPAGGPRARSASGARVVEAAASSGPGPGAAAGAPGARGDAHGASAGHGGSASAAHGAPPSDPISAPGANTAALRAHRFGSSASGGSSAGGAASASGAAASDGGASSGGGPLGGLIGNGNPMNPINMMLYRQLLSAGQRQKPALTNERPAVSLGVSHIE
jgi:hypothetical protein